MSGWIKLHRKVADNPLWTAESFTRGQAWIDMIMLASFNGGHIRANGMRINLDVGQVGWSELELSKRWKWSRGKVKRFLNELISDQMIVQQIDRRSNIITICNYKEYQGIKTTDSATDSTTDGQVTDKLRTSNRTLTKNVKNEKKYTSGDLAIADMMYKLIMDVTPKMREPNIDKWADTIRLMRERDNLTLGEIEGVFVWANSDTFWKGNILSPDKLREQFARLHSKSGENIKNNDYGMTGAI